MSKLSCKILSVLLLIVTFVGYFPGLAWAHGSKIESEFTEEEGLKYSQNAVGNIIRDMEFTDSDGTLVSLSEYRGKPLILNFIYTSCAHTCGVITASLEYALDVAWDALDPDSFNVITIGFDTRNDSPERMAIFAKQRGVKPKPEWRFLSGSHEDIDSLAQDVGFLYFSSPKGYDHLAQITVIDGQGKVTRQVYGENFDVQHLVEPLRALVFGTETPFASISDLIKKVRLFCTIYDPQADKYRFDYSIFIQLAAGIMVIGTVIILLIRELWRQRRRRQH